MAVPSGVDPHEVLGVPSGASPADVTAAYRRLAKRWHPDRAPVPGASDRMALINAAYDELRGEDGGAGRGTATGTGEHGRGAGPTGARGPGSPGVGDRPPVWPPGDPGAPPRAGEGAAHGRAGPAGRRADAADGPDLRRGDREPASAPGPEPTGTGPGGWAAGVFAAGTSDDGAAPQGSDGLTPALRSALGTELRSALQPGEEVGIVVPTSTWASPQTTLAVTDRRLLWLLDDAPVHRVRVLLRSDVVDVTVRPPRPWRPRAQVVCTDRRGRRTAFGELEPATAAAVARRVTPGRAEG